MYNFPRSTGKFLENNTESQINYSLCFPIPSGDAILENKTRLFGRLPFKPC